MQQYQYRLINAQGEVSESNSVRYLYERAQRDLREYKKDHWFYSYRIYQIEPFKLIDKIEDPSYLGSVIIAFQEGKISATSYSEFIHNRVLPYVGCSVERLAI